MSGGPEASVGAVASANASDTLQNVGIEATLPPTGKLARFHCDGCHKNTTGHSYMCAVCDDFDLCVSCHNMLAFKRSQGVDSCDVEGDGGGLWHDPSHQFLYTGSAPPSPVKKSDGHCVGTSQRWR